MWKTVKFSLKLVSTPSLFPTSRLFLQSLFFLDGLLTWQTNPSHQHSTSYHAVGKMDELWEKLPLWIITVSKLPWRPYLPLLTDSLPKRPKRWFYMSGQFCTLKMFHYNLQVNQFKKRFSWKGIRLTSFKPPNLSFLLWQKLYPTFLRHF